LLSPFSACIVEVIQNHKGLEKLTSPTHPILEKDSKTGAEEVFQKHNGIENTIGPLDLMNTKSHVCNKVVRSAMEAMEQKAKNSVACS
jgi:hypothetical protein